jgi:hypothetical protein
MQHAPRDVAPERAGGAGLLEEPARVVEGRMRRTLSGVVLAVVAVMVVGCGGGGGGAPADGAASAPGQGAVSNGTIPGGATVAFGSAYDPTTYAVADKSSKAKVGTTIVAVGRALAPVDGSDIMIEIKANGTAKPKRAPDVMDNPASATFFATDLTKDGLTPGTWIISYVNGANRVLASGYLTITP